MKLPFKVIDFLISGVVIDETEIISLSNMNTDNLIEIYDKSLINLFDDLEFRSKKVLSLTSSAVKFSMIIKDKDITDELLKFNVYRSSEGLFVSTSDKYKNLLNILEFYLLTNKIYLNFEFSKSTILDSRYFTDSYSTSLDDMPDVLIKQILPEFEDNYIELIFNGYNLIKITKSLTSYYCKEGDCEVNEMYDIKSNSKKLLKILLSQ